MGKWVTINGAHIYIKDDEPIGDSGEPWEGDTTTEVPKADRSNVAGVSDKELTRFENKDISKMNTVKLNEFLRRLKELRGRATTAEQKRRIDAKIREIEDEL